VGWEKVSRKFSLSCTYLHIKKPVSNFLRKNFKQLLKEIYRIAKEIFPKGGQLILFWSWARNEATEDSDRNYLLVKKVELFAYFCNRKTAGHGHDKTVPRHEEKCRRRVAL